eukprot:TRINITY_DN3562_c0_g3_i1.p1 TRINITY_DN3562_c0_g3~~TRINITY_DN3562_c0_g3_i1.p1  ORF type:complete len:557 (-),score=38.18 TRINITY_DN3562_c0_g3_i1:14-1684(-)
MVTVNLLITISVVILLIFVKSAHLCPKGVSITWYNSTGLTGEPLSMVWSNINFVYYKYSTVFTWPNIFPNQTELFSLEVETYISLPFLGMVDYFIGLDSDDGSRLWVDGELIYDHWLSSTTATAGRMLTLDSSILHQIRIQYFQATGSATLNLKWGNCNNGTSTFRIIEDDYFYLQNCSSFNTNATTSAPSFGSHFESNNTENGLIMTLYWDLETLYPSSSYLIDNLNLTDFFPSSVYPCFYPTYEYSITWRGYFTPEKSGYTIFNLQTSSYQNTDLSFNNTVYTLNNQSNTISLMLNKDYQYPLYIRYREKKNYAITIILSVNGTASLNFITQPTLTGSPIPLITNSPTLLPTDFPTTTTQYPPTINPCYFCTCPPPTDNVVCEGTSWVLYDSLLTQNLTLENTKLIIHGNLTLIGSLNIDSSELTVLGCINLMLSLNVELNDTPQTDGSEVNVTIVNTECSTGEFEKTTVSGLDKCKKVEAQQLKTDHSVIVIFKFTNNCHDVLSPGVILGITFGVLFVLVILVLLISYFVPSVKKKVLPFLDYKEDDEKIEKA